MVLLNLFYEAFADQTRKKNKDSMCDPALHRQVEVGYFSQGTNYLMLLTLALLVGLVVQCIQGKDFWGYIHPCIIC